MKKQISNPGFITSIFFWSVISFAFFSLHSAIAQQIIYKGKPQTETKKNVSKKGQETHMEKKEGTTPVPFATCSDMGAENGWGSWVAADGYFKYGGSPYPVFFGFGAPAAPRFNTTSGAGVDPCTQGTLGPVVPVVCPGFGNASIQLGQPNTNGLSGGCTSSGPYPGPGAGAAGNGCSEQLKYPLTVSAQDTNFIYAFAIVVENPAGGHTRTEAPFAEIFMLDQNGDTVACSHQKYIADLNGGVSPGFYKASCAGSVSPGYPPNGMIVSYKPWTYVGINLSTYIGQILTVVITNSDCALGGHYCYSYWDFACPPLSGSVTPFCLGQQTTVIGPPSDPSNPYTYTWYQNHNIYTGPPSATSQSITPTPAVGDTFAVHVHQQSGCDFWMPFAPQLLSINASFTLANSCGTVSFTDASTSPSAGPIISWNWSFPGGNPATSTIQNPVVTYPPGTYSVTLIVTSQSGCRDTMILPVTTGNPVADFNTGPVCFGTATQFTDMSTGGTNDPVSVWDWNFGDGTAHATTQSPSHVYAAAGTYSVTQIIATQSGCVDTIIKTVTVNPIPVPNFSSGIVCFNNPTVFTNLSTGIQAPAQWNWNFGDGNSSTQQNPSHTYGTAGSFTVILIVTNSTGCKDTVSLKAVVNPLPTANFTSAPVCFGNPTCFTDHSTVSPGSVTSWGWNFADPNSGLNNISNLQNPCHVFTASGTFTVILTATSDSGCQSTAMLPAVINPPPVAGFTNSSVCLNSSSSFTDGSTHPVNDPINGWNWNFGDGSPNSNLTNPSHVYTTAGNYTVSLIITTQMGCKDTVHNPVIVYNNPIANFTHPDSGCAPVCENPFTDLSQAMSGTIADWQWSFSGGSPSQSASSTPNVCWYTPGTYNVQLIVTTNYGCKDTMLIPQCIHVFAWPTADFCITPPQNSVNTPVFDFCNLWTPDVVHWTWNFGDNSSDSVNATPVHSYSATATNNDYYSYKVCLSVQNQHGCWDTICKPVELLPEFEFYIPNCFTPNQDGTNEFFFGKGRGIKDYNIWLFDRWGNMIWSCHYEGKNVAWDDAGKDGMPSACKWDGIVVPGGMDMGGNSGEYAQEDVYVWKVKLTDIFDKVHNYIGHVSIVK